MAEKLKIIPLGGLNEIGKNMTAYEYGGEIIVVDCGMAFPGDDMYGIDCIIPDVTYLIKNRARIRGLFITHGHEDHVGAIPYILKQVNMPIYCTRFTAGLIQLKLEEHGLVKSTKLITVEAGEMVRVLTEDFGNPSSQYALGRQAADRVKSWRADAAGALGCAPGELFFTSCGTEGDNWAIRAALHQNRRVGKHIVTTAVEHSAVLQCVKQLEREGYTADCVKPDGEGRISAEAVLNAVREDTALVSVMLVNNETGAVFPVAEIAAGLKDRPALLHTDAVQGFLKIPFTAKSLGADYITLSAHKIGGPKGVGALYIGGRAKNTMPLLFGGGQEGGLRPGTEATAQIAGFAKAAALRRQCLEETWRHLADCRAYAVERLGEIPDLCFVGQGDAPHILSVSLPGYPSQNIVSELSGKGICISAGSACHRGRVSHVLSAMGLDKKTAAGTVRVSFGPETTREDIDQLASALLEHRRTRFPML